MGDLWLILLTVCGWFVPKFTVVEGKDPASEDAVNRLLGQSS